MSALAFLSGLSSAAGDEYAKVADQKRLLQNSNNQNLADTIHSRLETDNTLDWPTYSSLRAQEYKLRGVPNNDAQQLLQHEKSVFDTEQQRKNQTQGSSTSTEQLPGLSAQVSLPPPPNYQGTPATTGDVRTHAQISNQQALFEAQIQKQREQLGLINGGNGNDSSGVDGQGHYYTTSGMGSNGGIEVKRTPDAGIKTASPAYADDIRKINPNAQTINGDPLPAGPGWFNEIRYRNGDKQYEPGQPQTTQKVVPSPEFTTGFAYVRTDPKNNVVGEPLEAPAPAGQQTRTVQSESLEKYTDPNTGQLGWKVIPRVSVTTPTANNPGAGTGATGALPTLPTHPNSIGTGPTQGSTGDRIAASSVAPQIQTVPGYRGSQVIPGTSTDLNRKGKPLDLSNAIDNQIFLNGLDSKMGGLEDAVKMGPTSVMKAKIASAYNQRQAELGILPNEVDAADRSRAQLALAWLDHINTVIGQINLAEQQGDLGLIKTRLNDYLTKDVGKDFTKGGVYAPLATNLKLLGTSAAMIHGGLRAASSPDVMEGWDQAMKAADPETMKAQLQTVAQWMQRYADIAKGTTVRTIGGGKIGASGPTGSVPQGQKKSLDEIFKGSGSGNK